MRKASFLFLLCLCFVCSFAQNEANIWYFGQHAGLDFNSGAPVALTNGSLTTSEGCASLSDRNGNLIFYSDGISVWTRNHTLMPNGTGLMGNPSSAQSAIIVPRPGSATLYYVFTVDDNGGNDGLRYSEVDMSLNGGLGDVVVASRNTPLLYPSAEKVTAVKHANGLYVWVIAHLMHNVGYYAYLVDCNGVQAPVISNVGQLENQPGWGYLVASPNGRKLASAMSNVGFELFDFDNATGVISNPVFLGHAGTSYGVSFSPNNNVLYGLRIGDGELYQWNVQAGSAAAINASVLRIGTGRGTDNPYLGGALQLGPDGRLYICDYMRPSLSVITQPDVVGPGCDLQYSVVSLAGRNSVLGLPPFIQSYFDTSAIIQTNGNCVAEPVNFSIGNTTSFLDSVRWYFGDAASGAQNTSTSLTPSHTYANGGIYTVQLIRYLDCILDTVELDITIHAPPAFTQDVVICTSVTFTRPGGGVVSAAGTYYDTLTASMGCDSVIITNLSVLGAAITVTNDTAVCLGSSVQLNVQGGIYGQAWSPAAGLNDSTITNPVATPQQTTSYIVTTQVQADDIIVNGDFSAGVSGFTSSYNLTTNLYPEGTYYVGPNPNSYHNGFNACQDHTTGSGNMMIINGSGNPGTPVFCQPVNVLPNTNYAFSCWVLSVVAGSPAILQFSINGTLLGNLFNAPSTACVWQQFYVIWNSGANTTANICIVNQNTTLGGNDFALDDISFMALCNAIDTVIITVNNPVSVTVDTAVCEGITYIFPDGSTSTISASNTSLLSNRFGCDSTVTTNLTMNPSPVTPVYDSICPGYPYTRPSGIVVNDAGSYTDTLSTIAGCDSIVITTLTLRSLKYTAFNDTACIGFPYTLPDGSTIQVPGNHSVILQADNGCDSTVTVSLEYFDIDLDVSTDVSMPVGETVDLHVSSPKDPRVFYAWTPSNALSCTTCPNPRANPLADMVYYVEATASVAGNTCYDNDTVPVTVIPDHSIFVPNAFTPNGDGENDFFEIFGNLFALRTLNVKVFNRTGEKVFESDEIHFKWNGIYRDEHLNPAVFVYVIEASFVDNFPDKIYKGSVTLLR